MKSLQVESLTLSRGERRLFQNLSFGLRAGEAVALTGANGAGKTSLLRAVAGLIRPDAGEVRFVGPTGPLDPEEVRGTGVHLLGHQDGLKSGRTAGEELGFWTRWLGGDEGGLRRAIERLALAPLLPLEVRRLSAGQRRRLALARLLASPRPLWLLDEPMAPLDVNNRARFGEIMADHLADGGLVLAAVHDPLPIAARRVEVGD